ncbi:MAG: class I SAM-dependent methyltransferase [Eubacteriales bacterium]|nr:class I SAM-dependent methyltransferase [Eubacteriales bacterium]
MLSNRLKTIVRMVPRAQTIADIGCDHGKVAVALVKNGRSQHVICGDISGKSLDKARKNAKGFEESISLREGNGLEVLAAGEADAAVLAGMGGELISDILNANKDKAPDTLVLSCNTASGLLRQWICENGYRIADEELVFENRHFYPVILALKGQSEKLSDIALEFGPVLLEKKPKVLRYFIKRRIDKTKEIRQQIEKSDSSKKMELLNQIDERLEEYAGIEKCL